MDESDKARPFFLRASGSLPYLPGGDQLLAEIGKHGTTTFGRVVNLARELVRQVKARVSTPQKEMEMLGLQICLLLSSSSRTFLATLCGVPRHVHQYSILCT